MPNDLIDDMSTLVQVMADGTVTWTNEDKVPWRHMLSPGSVS